jgi:hypothetical protein
MLVASTLDCKVEVPGGLGGLESQGRGHASHPAERGAVCLSCRAGFGLCGAVPVVII